MSSSSGLDVHLGPVLRPRYKPHCLISLHTLPPRSIPQAEPRRDLPHPAPCIRIASPFPSSSHTPVASDLINTTSALSSLLSPSETMTQIIFSFCESQLLAGSVPGSSASSSHGPCDIILTRATWPASVPSWTASSSPVPVSNHKVKGYSHDPRTPCAAFPQP